LARSSPVAWHLATGTSLSADSKPGARANGSEGGNTRPLPGLETTHCRRARAAKQCKARNRRTRRDVQSRPRTRREGFASGDRLS
jgi:hypothetical protein